MEDFKDIYIRWLTENIDQYQISLNIFRLTPPFMNRNNDNIDIYIIKEGENHYRVTDDGWTISDLRMSGFSIDTGTRRKSILASVLNSFGVSIEGDELYIESDYENLALKKHMLSQCMLKVDDLFYLSKTNVQSIFTEDVQTFFDSKEIRYVENVSFTGRSKLPAQYDFDIPRSRKYPERLIKAVNRLTTDNARSIIFTWTDTREERRPGSLLYTFIRDDGRYSEDARTALQEYGIKVAIWSDREKFVEELAS